MNLAGTWNLFIHVRDAWNFNKICVGVWIYRHSFTLFHHNKITAKPFLCFRMIYTQCPKYFIALSLGKGRIIQIQPNKSQNGLKYVCLLCNAVCNGNFEQNITCTFCVYFFLFQNLSHFLSEYVTFSQNLAQNTTE